MQQIGAGNGWVSNPVNCLDAACTFDLLTLDPSALVNLKSNNRSCWLAGWMVVFAVELQPLDTQGAARAGRQSARIEIWLAGSNALEQVRTS